jgi:hypothetical protein
MLLGKLSLHTPSFILKITLLYPPHLEKSPCFKQSTLVTNPHYYPTKLLEHGFIKNLFASLERRERGSTTHYYIDLRF